MAIGALRACPNVHSFRVEGYQVTSNIKQIKRHLCFRLPIEYFKVEPISVALCVRVDFAQQVILTLTYKVDRVQISLFKVTVELK